MEIKGKKVIVVGLGRSGVGAANLLSELQADVIVTDTKTKDSLKDFVVRLNPSVRLVLGDHPEEIFLSADMLVLSPGVPLNIPPITRAKSKGIPIIGELELAYQIVTSYNLQVTSKDGNSSPITHHPSPYFLAVTGTNGKSTTTALLDFMMKKGGFKTILGGNIGNALTEEILKASSIHLSPPPSIPPLLRGGEGGVDFIVTEVSSFQLETIKNFRPKVATILNITPDHLDRYHSLEEYSDAKARIFENQREEDFLVLNADDIGTMKVESEKLKVKSEKPEIFYFSRKKEVKGIYLKDGLIRFNFPDFKINLSTLRAEPQGEAFNLQPSTFKIKGVHNLENAMAAMAMALLAGCPVEAVIDSLKEFPGLEHRLEFVRELNGVRYFNDSKGTNVGAVIKSLESFTVPIILIAGGRDKAGDFSVLRHLVKERVKAIVLIGEAAEKIKKSLGDLTETITAEDLKEAVNISRRMSVRGDVVLLSPACASFDMFMDFEDRGRQFKKIVMEMA